jgi:Ohr subfamily peroxiredoxin
MTKIIYTTKATATGGRVGSAQTEDGAFKVTLDKPKEMGGKGEGVNPEQLFACGYSACFLGALKHVAGQEKVSVPDDATVSATVGIGPREDGTGFGLDVALELHIPGMDKAQAEELMNKAHIVCPYSDFSRGNVTVRLAVA